MGGTSRNCRGPVLAASHVFEGHSLKMVGYAIVQCLTFC